MKNQGMTRMQELLSSYYGLQDQESRQEQERNIDSSMFDSKLYVKELLKTRGLNDLLRTDDRLIREVKELDTNMQMLVYENYNKFISATDTIRRMKSNVASMEEEAGRVVQSMDIITAKSESINAGLTPHRSKVEKLISVRRLLKRLEFIFELPQRLETAVKQEEYKNAVKYYLLARRILRRYEHVSSFKTIQLEAEKIIEQLECLLKKRMFDTTLESEEVCKTVAFLHQLDACNDEIQNQFIAWHQAYFKRAVAVLKFESKAIAVLDFLQRFDADVITKMGRVLAMYKTYFMSQAVADVALSTSRKSIDDAILQDDLLAGFVTELFAMYLEECNKQFRRPHTEYGSTDEVLNVLQNDGLSSAIIESDYFVFMGVMKYFVSQVEVMDGCVPMCGLSGCANKFMESCVQFQIGLVFEKVYEDVRNLFVAFHEDVCSLGRNMRDDGQSVLPLAHESARAFADLMQKVMQQIRPMMLTGYKIFPEFSRLFFDLVQSQFYDFLKWFNESVLEFTEPKRAFIQPCGSLTPRHEKQNSVTLPWLEPAPQFLLFLACMCQELSVEGINECVCSLNKCLPVPSSPITSSDSDLVLSRQMYRQDVTHMIEVTRKSSAALLHHVAKQYGNELCVIIHNEVAATSWADIDEEPKSVQEMMVAVVKTTFQFGKEIAVALGEEQSIFVEGNSRAASIEFHQCASVLRPRSAGVAAASLGAHTMPRHDTGIQLDVNRMFARKISVYPSQLELTADAFVQTMLRLCIKAFSEWVRLLELSKFGLQQIQLNAEFLCSTLIHFVVAGNAKEEVKSLLANLLSNARGRAVEDALMDQSKVIAIVSAKSAHILSRLG